MIQFLRKDFIKHLWVNLLLVVLVTVMLTSCVTLRHSQYPSDANYTINLYLDDNGEGYVQLHDLKSGKIYDLPADSLNYYLIKLNQ